MSEHIELPYEHGTIIARIEHDDAKDCDGITISVVSPAGDMKRIARVESDEEKGISVVIPDASMKTTGAAKTKHVALKRHSPAMLEDGYVIAGKKIPANAPVKPTAYDGIDFSLFDAPNLSNVKEDEKTNPQSIKSKRSQKPAISMPKRPQSTKNEEITQFVKHAHDDNVNISSVSSSIADDQILPVSNLPENKKTTQQEKTPCVQAQDKKQDSFSHKQAHRTALETEPAEAIVIPERNHRSVTNDKTTLAKVQAPPIKTSTKPAKRIIEKQPSVMDEAARIIENAKKTQSESPTPTSVHVDDNTPSQDDLLHDIADILTPDKNDTEEDVAAGDSAVTRNEHALSNDVPESPDEELSDIMSDFYDIEVSDAKIKETTKQNTATVVEPEHQTSNSTALNALSALSQIGSSATKEEEEPHSQYMTFEEALAARNSQQEMNLDNQFEAYDANFGTNIADVDDFDFGDDELSFDTGGFTAFRPRTYEHIKENITTSENASIPSTRKRRGNKSKFIDSGSGNDEINLSEFDLDEDFEDFDI